MTRPHYQEIADLLAERDLVKAGALIIAEIERLDRRPDGGQP
jgi:hypothetical protein